MGRLSTATLAMLLVASSTPALAAGIGPWTDGDQASARLIAEGIGADGAVRAGIEIVMPPGWKTYWRSPGDAGIEPVFDFTASQNAGDVEVHFPTPQIDDDGYSITNVYKTHVIFPISVQVHDTGSPVRLVGDLKFGVCEIVCVSDHVVVEMNVTPGATDLEAAEILRAAWSELPGEPVEGALALTDVRRDGGTEKRPVYLFSAKTPDAPGTDVFIDGPEGWYPAVPKLEADDGGVATWRVKFSRVGSDVELEDANFTVVLKTEGGAIQQDIAPGGPGS